MGSCEKIVLHFKGQQNTDPSSAELLLIQHLIKFTTMLTNCLAPFEF